MIFSSCKNQIDLKQDVPLDPSVRTGKLENGMSYYIRKNAKPENRAEFYIVHNVGAILENDDQNGLAHFTEHMAFNGTKNFPGKGIINFVERHGMAFGRNLNAFTSKDVTAYMVSQIPLDKADYMIDSCLLILHDWSGSILMKDEELDAERGVIHEEWRTGRNASFRMQNELAPIIYKGSKYAKRDVIGDIDVIDNFEYQTIRDFYHDWYRPDLQAVILVGDFDLDLMESKVKELFSKIPKRENPKEREYFQIPDNDEPLIGIASDPEAQNVSFTVYYKHDPIADEAKNLEFLRTTYVRQLFNTMINARLSEISQNENPPFIYGYASYSSFERTKDAYYNVAASKANTGVKALETLLVENLRLKKHGFTNGELERAKKEVLKRLEKAYKEKDNQDNGYFVWQYFSHFLENDPIPSIDFEFDFAQKVLPGISLDEMNQLPEKWITEKNMIVTVTGPESKEVVLPTEEDVKKVLVAVNSKEIMPYEDKVSDEPLVKELPKKSKVVKESTNETLGYTEWELKNGAKVVFKQTDFKADEILFSAVSFGGKSLLKVEELPSADMSTIIASMSGVGNFDNISLEKMLSGKNVRLNPYLGNYEEGFNGSTTPADFETLLQLLYLRFEQPRFDEKAFSAYMSRMKAFMEMSASDPRNVFRDSTSFITNDRNVRRQPMNVAYLDKVELAQIEKIYKERFSNAADFTFFFVGNVDLKKVKPLIETYIGGISSSKKTEKWNDDGVGYPENDIKYSFKKAMKTPKTSVYVNYNNAFEYTLENRINLDAIRYILSMRYVETIREEQGGTYGVGVYVTRSKYPNQNFSLNMMFDTDPAKYKFLTEIIHEEVKKMATEGPKAEDVNKTIEFFIKQREVQMKENRFWLNSLEANYTLGMDIVAAADYEKIIRDISAEKLQQVCAKLLEGATKIEIVMLPE